MAAGWIIAVLAIGAIYLVYITMTQPEAGFRIITAILTALGRILYWIAIGLYKIVEGITNFISWIFMRRRK